MSQKIFAENNIAHFNYFIKQTFEAGLSLEGWEVKSIRDHKVSIKEGYIINREGNIEIVGMHISPSQKTSYFSNVEPTRTRRLLLNRNEINKIIGFNAENGQTVIPLKLYETNGKIKLLIGFGVGKNQKDKRETVKERDWKREQSRIMKKKS